jgi:kumamolisin
MSDIARNQFVPLPGSERRPVAGAKAAAPLDDAEQLEVTLVTRRRMELPGEYVAGPATLTREQLADRHGADPADLARIRDVLTAYELAVTSTDASSRRVRVAGTVAAMAGAFGASLSRVSSTGPTGLRTVHRYRVGSLRLPTELSGIVTAVLGLDDRPQARAHFRFAAATGAAAAPATYTPVQVGACYKFPPGTDGSGQNLAIIELGGGFSTGDLNTYFSGLGITPPAVTAVSVDGAVNTPGKAPAGADAEVLLDIEVAGALAPGAAQFVYFAPNTDQGFVDAVSTAVHAAQTPTALSISWGQSEDSWTGQARGALDQAFADAAALGVTVCVAAGDNGSTDGQQDGQSHTDFPASSPHALACGGTSMVANGATGAVTSETVWNDGPGQGATGGGVSDVYGLPAWQTGAGVPARAGGGSLVGRGVPDVAGDADPATGYQVLVDGKPMVIGGTSAVAPLWAALVSRLAEGAGTRFGLLPPLLYAGVSPGQTTAGFRDITVGNNGAYAAGPGWDSCTGLGVPDGTALLASLRT